MSVIRVADHITLRSGDVAIMLVMSRSFRTRLLRYHLEVERELRDPIFFHLRLSASKEMMSFSNFLIRASAASRWRSCERLC